MSEKNGKMKFKIGAKRTNAATGKTEIKVVMDCPAPFIIVSMAHLLIDKNNQVLADALKEAFLIADIAKHSPDPAAMVDKLAGIKADLCAGAEGDTTAGVAGLVSMLSLLDEVIGEKPTKGSGE